MQLAGQITSIVYNHRLISIGDSIDGKIITYVTTLDSAKYRFNRDYNMVTIEGDDGLIATFTNVPLFASSGIGEVSFAIINETEDGKVNRVYRIGGGINGRTITRIYVGKSSPPSVIPNFAAYDKLGNCVCRGEDADASIEIWYAPFESF